MGVPVRVIMCMAVAVGRFVLMGMSMPMGMSMVLVPPMLLVLPGFQDDRFVFRVSASTAVAHCRSILIDTVQRY
jgi:hypothetical protein